MPYTFSTPDDFGDIQASELHTSLGERLGAQGGEAFFGASRTLYRAAEYKAAENGGTAVDDGSMQGTLQLMPPAEPVPETPIADAKLRVKQEGLEGRLKLPDQPTIKQPVLDLMIQHGHERADYDAAVSRGPQGFLPGALGMATEIGAGIIDPVNIAAFSIPVLGEARAGMMVARAGESLAMRAGVKAGIGAAQGAVGSAALVPGDWWLHTKDGIDYTYADALRSIVLGAGMGGLMHAGIGGAGDILARAADRPMHGTVEDLHARALGGDVGAVELLERMKAKRPGADDGSGGSGGGGTGMTPENGPADASGGSPGREGVSDTDVPGISGSAAAPAREAPPVDLPADEGSIAPHPAEVLASLPPRAREDVTRASMADTINGNDVRGAELLEESAKADPRIAESIEAWHGSPHDFDRFDMSRIGTGEGAQAYGHGLYFAENPEVAKSYQESLVDSKVDGQTYNPENPVHYAAGLLEEFKTAKAALADVARRKARDPSDSFLEEVAQRLRKPETLPKIVEKSNLYQVRINANRDHFLDYDTPLGEQSQHVRDALLNHPDPMIAGTAEKHGKVSGGEFYRRLAQRLGERHRVTDGDIDGHIAGMPITDHAAASSALREAGIPGIKYFDQGSRQPFMRQELAAVETAIRHTEAEVARVKSEIVDNKDNGAMLPAFFVTREAHIADLERKLSSLHKQIEAISKYTENGTRNLVVFDDKHVDITHKNGEPVSRGERAEILHAKEQAGEHGADVLPGPRTAKGPRARDPETWSLAEFLAARGGIRADDPLIGDVRGSIGTANKFVPGFGNLIRNPRQLSTAAKLGGGHAPMTLDQAREAAVEAGYLRDHGADAGGESTTTVRTLLDAIDREMRGDRVYREGHERESAIDPGEERHRIESAAHDALRDDGVDPAAIPDKTMARVVEIMHREGERDPLAAYERALTEEGQNATEAGQHERITDTVPGWDVPDDAGAASARGGDLSARGQPDNGGAARDAGLGDREAAGGDATGRGAGAVKPNFQRLEDIKRSGDEDLDEASRTAEHAPEPESTSTEPAKVVSAAERAAVEADKLLEDILPTLSEEERAIFKQALDNLEQDKAAREQIVREGTACLLAAVA